VSAGGRPALPPHATAQARGRIAYWERGEGSPVLLLHSFPDHAVGMLPLAERLAAAGHRAIVPALPGWWPSEALEGEQDYVIPALAEDLLALLDGLGIDRCGLVGHGWGAEIGYHLGARNPERLTALVALGVPHKAGFANRHLVFQELLSAGYAYFLAYNRNAPRVASSAQWLTAAVSWASPGMHREDWPTILGLLGRESEATTACRYYRQDLERSATPEQVHVPTTVIHGAQTPAVRPTLYEGLEQWFTAGMERHELAHVGQWPHLEDPETVDPLVLAALAGASA